MSGYTYHNNVVKIPRNAEVSSAFRDTPRAIFFSEVQTAINEIESWEKGEDPIYTFDIPFDIGARVVQLAQNEEPLWGVNPYHKARYPQESPYLLLDRRDPRATTDEATIELSGTPDKPMLIRAYPGDYMPPLPWMSSAKDADGGREQCLEYWQTHAFMYRGRPDELSTQAPDWYQASR